jgi:DNA invertase Pin-like site-specific DNA recombinase
MSKAISYMRFSSTGQAKGSTLARQQAMVDRWLRDHPSVELSNLSAKDEGRSGYAGVHLKHGLGAILAAIKDGKIVSGDYILVEAVDRIGRLDFFQMLQIVQDIVSAGVTIVTLEDNVEYTYESLTSGNSSIYILIGKVQQAHEYSKNLSRRVAASYSERRKAARSGGTIKKHTVWWLDTSGKIIPERGAVIKSCIDDYLKGHGYRKIFETYAAQLPDISPVSTLKLWFRSRALLGEWVTNGETIEGVFEPLIDSDTFYKVQAQMARKRTNPAPPERYFLTGLVVCGVCGRKFATRINKSTSSGDEIRYCNCRGFLTKGKLGCSNAQTWPYQLLMTIIDETSLYHLGHITAGMLNTETSDKLAALQSEIENVNSKINKLLDLLVDMPDSSNVKDKLIGLNKEKESLLAQKQSVETVIETQYSTSLDSDVLEVVRNRVGELMRDRDYLKDTLLKSGFRITVNDRTAVYKFNDQLSFAFEYVKRTFKYRSYIMTCKSSDSDHIHTYAVSGDVIAAMGAVSDWEELFTVGHYESNPLFNA